jgi:hypothetical protein
MLKNSTPKFYIVKGTHEDPYEVWSVVPTNFGSDVENFVCSGSRAYCEDKIEMLKKGKKK